MEKITTYELLNALKRNLKYIIVSVLLFAVLGFVYAKFVKEEAYTSETTIIIVGNQEEEITYNKILLNEKLSNIYSEILKSEDLYQKVINNLKLEDIKAKDLKDDLKSTVNPQAGIISLELTTDNKDKSVDILTSICEEFKTYVREYMNTDNIEYLQNVTISEDYQSAWLKFTIFGAVIGGLLGLLFVSLKEVLKSKITSSQYIKDLNYPVLGVIEKPNKDVYKKIAAKIYNENLSVIAITSTEDRFSSSQISYELSKVISQNHNTLYLDFDNESMNDSVYANINSLYKGNIELEKDGKLSRLNFTKSDDVDIVIESKEFMDLFKILKERFDYIIINEKSTKSAQAFLACKFEDGKIFIVREDKTDKQVLQDTIQEIESLDTNIIGVIYNK